MSAKPKHRKSNSMDVSSKMTHPKMKSLGHLLNFKDLNLAKVEDVNFSKNKSMSSKFGVQTSHIEKNFKQAFKTVGTPSSTMHEFQHNRSTQPNSVMGSPSGNASLSGTAFQFLSPKSMTKEKPENQKIYIRNNSMDALVYNKMKQLQLAHMNSSSKYQDPKSILDPSPKKPSKGIKHVLSARSSDVGSPVSKKYVPDIGQFKDYKYLMSEKGRSVAAKTKEAYQKVVRSPPGSVDVKKVYFKRQVGKTTPLNILNIKKEEEADGCQEFIDNLESKADKVFHERIDLYNKYYIDHLFDPGKERTFFNSKDMKVSIKPQELPQNVQDQSHDSNYHLLNPTKQVSFFSVAKITRKNVSRGMTIETPFNRKMISQSGSPNRSPDASPMLRSIPGTPMMRDQLNPFSTQGNKSLFQFQKVSKNTTNEESASPQRKHKGSYQSAEEERSEMKKIRAQEQKYFRSMLQIDQMKTLISPRGPKLGEREKEFLAMVKDCNYQMAKSRLNMDNKLANIRDTVNETPLHWAVKKNDHHMVDLLLLYESDIDATDMVGRKPIDIAKHQKNDYLVYVLKKAKDEKDGKYLIVLPQEQPANANSRPNSIEISTVSKSRFE